MSMMDLKGRVPNFELDPKFEMKGIKAYEGAEIVSQIKKAIEARKAEKTVVVFDYYYGIDEEAVKAEIIDKLGADLLIDTNEVKISEEKVQEKFGQFITDDRENGVCCTCRLDDFFCPTKKEEANKKIADAKGLVIVYGVGAGCVACGDILVYGNIDHEVVVTKFNNTNFPNWGATNGDEDPLRKNKRDSYLEERVFAWHKLHIMEEIDFMLDGTNGLVMLTGDDYREVMDRFTKRPFEMVPKFRPGVWGGHWCQEVLGAAKEEKNTAWGLTAFLDWMSVQAVCDGKIVTIPGKDIVFYRPKEILGPQVFFNWGYKCPTTMDFLDTMGGGNLSLQVHPHVAYLNENYNFQYPHHESYYMLDTTDHSSVYLGLKNGVEVADFVAALKEAQKTGTFDDTKYVNRIPMKTHDHIFIPSGTVHCSGVDTLVLELNPTGCITYKLWDWGRLGLDGKPRPINIEHGANVIQKYDTDFTMDRLVSKKTLIGRGDGWVKENSGLMEYEPMVVNRYWVTKDVVCETENRIKLLCIVEGEEAVIESLDGSFEPMPIHYAEGIVMPARVGKYRIKPCGRSEGKKIAFVECFQSLTPSYF